MLPRDSNGSIEFVAGIYKREGINDGNGSELRHSHKLVCWQKSIELGSIAIDEDNQGGVWSRDDFTD